jgi:PKD repeat protein
MKQITIFMTSVFVLATSIASGQRQLDPSNMREGESVEYCRQHKHQIELMKNPAAAKIIAADQLELQRAEEAYINNRQQGVVYNVPIVFHVLHNGGNENISRDQILDALFILNRDFRLENTDVNNIVSQFQGMPIDAEINFVLATKAPDGSCFSGITRTQSPMSYQGANGNAQVDAIVAGNDVFNGQWPGNRYLNVFICGDIDGAAGYTYTPNSWIGTSMKNGIWVLHNYVGSIGTSSAFSSRTLTHEVGHWLNLQHTWGPNNNPGNPASCSDDDGVADTPRCIGLTSCNLNANTCSNDATDGYWTVDGLDNTENYMDYSYCSKMFTPGQVNRMRAALTSSVGGRNNLWTNTNLANTGATGNPPLCAANFMVNNRVVCPGSTVNFIDDSYHNVSTWTWSFPGGTPASSPDQNPSVVYDTPGTYEVTLTVGDGTTTVSETKTAYITVMDLEREIPIVEGFEIGEIPTDFWYTKNASGEDFTISSTVSASGTYSLQHLNTSANNGQVDEFISKPINIDGTTGLTISFKYAFAKKSDSNAETLRVLASSNCGNTWSVRKSISTFQIATAPNTTASFVPTPDQWRTETITNIGSSFWTENFQLKFEFIGGGGNILYIDDINIYNQNTTALSITEAQWMGSVELFPNPSSTITHLNFQMENESAVSIQLVDMLGKTIQNIENSRLTSGEHRYEINTNALSTGIYLINLSVDGLVHTQKLIVE